MSIHSSKNQFKSNNVTISDLKSFVSFDDYSNSSLVLIGLKKVLSFFIDCEVHFGEKYENYHTLLSYFDTEVPCQEIFEIWIYFYQYNEFSIISIIFEILTSVIRITGLLGSYTLGNKIIKRILNFHIKSIYRNLNSNVTPLVVRSIILLIEMSCFNSGSLILEVFSSFDFSHKVISKILKDFSKISNDIFPQVNKQLSVFETPRIFMIKFILCFLKLGPISLKLELLNYKNIFYEIFSGFIRDNTSFVRDVLDIMIQHVIFEKGIPRNIKVSVFNEHVLDKLIILYSETDDEVSRSITIHNFLLLLCTRPGIGLCFDCNGWYPKLEADFKKSGSFLVHNRVLAAFIFKLKVTRDILQQELFLKICEACPELIAYCSSQFNINMHFEPRLTVSWLSISSIYQSIILFPIPSMIVCNIPYELIFSSILENIIPLALTKMALSLGLRHNSNLVVFFTVNLILSSIDKYYRIVTILDKKDYFNAFVFEQKKFRQLLKEMFLERLPDIHIIFSIFKSVWEKSSNLLKFSITKLFMYYIELFPEILFFQKHDYSSILIKGFSGISEDISYSSLILCYLFRISRKFLPILKWWNRKQECSESIFTILVKFYLFCKNEEFRNEYKNLISCLLLSSNAFSSISHIDSGELILKSLDDMKCFFCDIDVIVDFLGDSLMFFMNCSYKYMDDYLAFLSDYELKDNQKFPSLILIVLVEQWNYFFSRSTFSSKHKILVALWLSRALIFFTLNEETWNASKKICLKLVNLTQKQYLRIAYIFNETKMYIEFLDASLFLDGVFFKSSKHLTSKKCYNTFFINCRCLSDLLSNKIALIDFILRDEIFQSRMHFDNILHRILCKYVRVCLLDVIVLKRLIYILLNDKRTICDFNDIVLKYFRIIRYIGNVLRNTKDFERFKKIIVEENKWKDNYLNFECNVDSSKINTFSKEFIHLIVEFINPSDSFLLLEILDKTYKCFMNVLTDKSLRDMSLSSNEWNEILLLLNSYLSKDFFLKISTEILRKYVQEIRVFMNTDSDIFGFFEPVFNHFFMINNIETWEFSDLILVFNVGLKIGYCLDDILEVLANKIYSSTDDVIYDFYTFIENDFFLTLQNTDSAFSRDLISKLCNKSSVFFEIVCGKLCEILKKHEDISNLPFFFFTSLLCVINAYILWKDDALQNKKHVRIDISKSRLVYLLRCIEDDLLNGFLDENEKGSVLFQILFKSIKTELLFKDGKRMLDKLCIRYDKMILSRRFIEIIEIATCRYGNGLVDDYIGIWFTNIVKLLIECFSEEELSNRYIIFLDSFINYLKLSKKQLSKYVLENFFILLIETGLKNHILVYDVVKFIFNIVKEFNMENSTLFVSLVLSKSNSWKETNTSVSFEHRLIIVQLLYYFICNLSNQISLSINESIYEIYSGTTHIIDRILLRILQKNEEFLRCNFFDKKIVFNIESCIKKSPIIRFSCDKRDIIATLSSELLNKSIYFFPIINESLDFLETDNKILLDYNDEVVYDPLFLLPLILACITLEEQVLIKSFIDSNILGYILISLSSDDRNVRKMSLIVLSDLKNKISTTYFSEKSQLLMFFQVLKSSISTSSIELSPIPYVVSLFMALSIQIITNPSHFLFDEVCRFYLQRSKLDFQDIPIFYAFWNTSYDYYKRSNWLISFLTSGLRTLMDYELYKKRHIFELLCCLFSSDLITNESRSKIISFFLSVSNIYQVSASLVYDYGIVSWVEQQIAICKNMTLKSMLICLFLRLYNSKSKTMNSIKKSKIC
ncbi:hypothetical protein PORY_001103 [Pneumocystis oryctolagi]|uniref:Uncharacterized protein n=1 Tax=Pneumocystis oryctolagi TaxID=42067 RepID=A0ACB7CG66_9ASCO|nr:hypothetical protein PORY_001103 [Pneumocystis oryctolagi]